jgi:cytochrome c oxidase subunit 2
VLLDMLGALALGPLTAIASSKERVIDIVARRFDFAPDELHVSLGETVVLRFTAPDVPMGFNLADFGLRADIVPDAITTLRLTPDKVGSFTFFCDVFCGSGHEEMSGMLVVD